MELLNLEFVDFKKSKKGGFYTYTFAGMLKAYFIKSFIKFTFKSKLPQYTWKDIQITLVEKQIFTHQMVYGRPVKLGIGQLTITKFTKQDIAMYGKCPEYWKGLRFVATQIRTELSNAFLDED